MIVINNTDSNTDNSRNKQFGELAVVTCYFNWCDYKTPARNLHRFIRSMKVQDVPLFGIELSITNHFETAGIPGWRHFKVASKNICFQKEALINLCVKKLHPRFTKIAWIDCDVEFDTKDWYVRLSTALDYKKLIQPFRTCYWTDQKGHVYKDALSFFLDQAKDQWAGHPGFAMACTRDYFTQIGLFPYCAIGNGDTIFAFGVCSGPTLTKYEVRGVMPDNVKSKKYLEWKRKTKKFFSNDYGVIDGCVYHEHHGSFQNRDYWNRCQKYLANYNFEKHVRLDERGILEFTDEFTVEQRERLLEYFKNRKEDD